jgi:hypothetical protein
MWKDTENPEAIRSILQELEVSDKPENLVRPKRQRILLADDHAVMRKGLVTTQYSYYRIEYA